MKKTTILLALIFLAAQSFAQTAREEIAANPAKAGGVMYAYPGPQSVQTPAPKGYKPFYVSHFGRHGSRWNCRWSDYDSPYTTLKAALEAGKLTPKGKEVLSKVAFFREDARDRIGELTSLGMRQHQGIAKRMFESFPEAFKGTPEITANSTQSPRVMISMFYFCEQLKSLNPKIMVNLNSSERDASFVAHRTEESELFRESPEREADEVEYQNKCYHPERLMRLLFNDEEYVSANVDTANLYELLYEIAVMAQNNEIYTPELYSLFEKEELYDIWQSYNYGWYSSRSSNPKGGEVSIAGGLPMLKHFIEKADEYIASGKNGATLRFSHDGYLIPLATSMRLDGCRGVAEKPEDCADVFVNYKVSPMGGNVQWVFFRNRKGDVIVKFLLNENEVGIPVETDMYPYYCWSDVKRYYEDYYKL
ncbi:MAG: histidine-type phosphatase [Bacteroidales bacterium]|nr:histidine-type phosphatase [Bacteroidales bacterium]